MTYISPLQLRRQFKGLDPKKMIECTLTYSSMQMDETVINGANIFFADQFGIDPSVSGRNQWLLGLVNSAPYVCIARLRNEC